jgi:hypothetical protein
MKKNDVKALAGNVGGLEREQTVLTPSWLFERLGQIALDPCTTPDNPVRADVFYTMLDDGLTKDWPTTGLTYVNPPYCDLEGWLRKCRSEAQRGCKIVVLCPLRTWRKWFIESTEGYVVSTCAPFSFVDHKSAYPAPLCVIWYNVTPIEIIVPLKKDKTKKLFTGHLRVSL